MPLPAPGSINYPDGFLDRPDLHQALRQRDFGEVFRLICQYTGLTQSQLGALIDMSQSRISTYIRTPKRLTSAAVLERVIDGLNLPDHLRAMAGLPPVGADGPSRALPERGAIVLPSDGPLAVADTSTAPPLLLPGGNLSIADDAEYNRLVNNLIEWAKRTRRRDILQWISWAASAAAAAPALDILDIASTDHAFGTAPIAPSRSIDPTIVDDLDAVLWRCIRYDDALGPQATLNTILTQRQIVRGLLPATSGVLRERVLSLFASYSRFAGWLSFDLNNHAAALEYYETARIAAHEAQDTRLGAFILCNLSHLATWQGRARVGIDHAVAAKAWAARTEDSRLKAYACDVAARAYALDGQEPACIQELDEALNYLAAHDERPSLVHFYDPALHASVRGLCMMQLRHSAEAVSVTLDAISAIDTSFVRNLAMTSLDLGAAYVQFRQPEQSAQTVATAIDLATQNRSPRLIRQIQAARKRLDLWSDTQAVRELDDRMSAYGLAFNDA
jgi:tetratricopeptide (TPR) repeat protein